MPPVRPSLLRGFPAGLVLSGVLGLGAGSATAATWYVRTDGGTATQCTGAADAPYPGTGTNQACALAHPFWALDADGAWRIAGGDTVLIGPGSYQIGFGAPNTGWCDAAGSYGCVLPPLPSGTPGSPTRVLGKGWDAGCPVRPALWGTERAYHVLDLTGTSDAVVDCLEITDRSSCALWHCNPAVRCERDTSPYGPYADAGIVASASARVALRHLDVHGMAESGVLAAGLTDWTVEDVRLAGNGSAGWNGDVGPGSACSGSMTFRRLLVERNGCPETYPGLQPDHCWGQETCGGYGDGVGFARTGAAWTVEDSVFRWNVSDGLDLLYVGVDHPAATVDVRRSQAYGNGGNQLKVGGTVRVVNALAVSDCAYFLDKPFGQEMGPLNSADHCRAGGAAIALSVPRGGSASVVNSTVASQGWALVEVYCNTHDFPDQPACLGTERATLTNSVFYGHQVVYLDYERLTDFVGDGDPEGFTTASTVDFDVIHQAEVSSPTGTNVTTDDPLVLNGTVSAFDGRLRPGSPALDTGLPVGSLSGLVPADDLLGTVRPSGAGVDRGAYERAPSEPLRFYTLPPCRLLDTRTAVGPTAGPAIPASGSRDFPVGGACGVPPAARAVSLNVTATGASAAGWLALYPGGGTWPGVSNVNFAAGATRASNAICALSATGTLTVRNGGPSATHAILDVNGYFR